MLAMSSLATCTGLAARCGKLVLSLEQVDGQWRITIADAERNVVLHRARGGTLEDAKQCAQDLALVYQAAQNSDAAVTEEELVWTAAVA
jgi:hypothetical protein